MKAATLGWIALLVVVASLSWMILGQRAPTETAGPPPAANTPSPKRSTSSTSTTRVSVPTPEPHPATRELDSFEVEVVGLPAALRAAVEILWVARRPQGGGDPIALGSKRVRSDSPSCRMELAPARRQLKRLRTEAKELEFSLRMRRIGANDAVQILAGLPSPDQRIVLDIEPEGVRLSVRVLDAQGKLVSHPARVDVTWVAPAEGPRRESLRAIEGTTEVWPVRTGCTLEVYASHGALRAASRRWTGTISDTPVQTVELVMEHGIAFRGRLVDASRQPLREQRVTGYLVDVDFDSSDNERIRSAARDQFHLVTDQDGFYQLGLRPLAQWNPKQKFMFCVWGRDRALTLHGSCSPETEAPEKNRIHDLGEVVLRAPAPLPVLISGLVLGTTGVPMETATDRVQLRVLHTDPPPPPGSKRLPASPKPLPLKLVWPGPPGQFEFRGEAPPGLLTVHATSSGLGPARCTIDDRARGQPVTMRLTKATTVHGRLLLGAGLSSEMFFAKIRTSDGERTVDVRAASFHCNGLPSGDCHISILTRGTEAIVGERRCVLPLPAHSDPKGLILDVRGAVRLVSLRFRGPSGQFLRHQQILVQGNVRSEFSAWLRTGKNGELALPVPRSVTQLQCRSEASGSVVVEPATLGQEVLLPAR